MMSSVSPFLPTTSKHTLRRDIIGEMSKPPLARIALVVLIRSSLLMKSRMYFYFYKNFSNLCQKWESVLGIGMWGMSPVMDGGRFLDTVLRDRTADIRSPTGSLDLYLLALGLRL